METSNPYLARNLSLTVHSDDTVHFKDVILEAHQYFLVKLLVLHPSNLNPIFLPVGHVAGVKEIIIREPYKEVGHLSVWAGAFKGALIVQLVRLVSYFILAILLIVAIAIPSVSLSTKVQKHKRKVAVQEFRTITDLDLKKSDDFIFRAYVTGGQSALSQMQTWATKPPALETEFRLYLHKDDPTSSRETRPICMRRRR